MSIANFIPTIWEARLLAHLDKELVYGNLANRDYEGDIKAAGNVVKINQIGDIAVRDYKKGTDITFDDVDGAQTTLTIDQQKYFAFKVDDVDAAQANVNLIDGAMQRASYKMRDTVDQYIAGFHTKAGVTKGLGDDTTPLSITSATKAYESLVDLKGALDDENVPVDGRFVVVPSAFYGFMLKDSRFVAAGTARTRMARSSRSLLALAPPFPSPHSSQKRRHSARRIPSRMPLRVCSYTARQLCSRRLWPA